jgi:predicted MFS family arabinose efflux permease
MVSNSVKKMIVILGFLAFFTNGDNYAAAPLLIDIARDLNVNIGSAALSVTSYMLFFGLLTIIFGPLGDRFGKSRILKITAFGTGIFSIVCALATSLHSLIALRAVNGAFAAGILPVTIALVGESAREEQRQNVIGKVMGMMFLGGAVATVIGGSLAYLGSWRLVYSVYGVAELILAFGLLKILVTSPGKIDKLSFTKVYKEALLNRSLIKVISMMFLIGFGVLGSFSFAGKLVENKTGFNILFVGLLLSLFGLGTLVGGRNAGTIRNKLGNKSLLFAGMLGGISLCTLAFANTALLMGVALLGFGISFIFLQSTLVTTAQELVPQLRGTVMSLASFSMFISGGFGTLINSVILNYWNIESIYIVASIALLMVGFLATVVFRNDAFLRQYSTSEIITREAVH